MTLVSTSGLRPDLLPAYDRLQTYCGLDCVVTLEVQERLQQIYGDQSGLIYKFELALQAPYFDMMQRGWAIDSIRRQQEIERLRQELVQVDSKLQDLSRAVWDKGLNPASPKQLQEFFYGAMRLPEIWISQKGERKLSTNREALEKLDDYLYAKPFVSLILQARDLAKQLSVLETDLDADGRFRTSYNIAGTETGRPSSSENAFGTGGNAQNVAPRLRHIFVADPGYKLVSVDLEQVEARDVGFFIGCLFDDWTFLDSCESGDLHTNNARLIWPDLGWTGQLGQDRKIAEQTFYREFSYRDMAKRGSHLSNYKGTAWTAARSLKVPQKIMEEFQARYCRGSLDGSIKAAFPGIPRWWDWVTAELQTKHYLVTSFGRRRHFFGRPGEDTTIREAIAFLPQSTTADRMNLGLWRVWKYEPRALLLGQGYDSITFQVRESDVDEVTGRVLELIRVELCAPSGRKYVVPGEAKIGWNWGSFDRVKNPEGLIKWKPGVDKRERRSGLNRGLGG